MNLKLYRLLTSYHSVREYFRSITIAWIGFFISLGITYLLWSSAQQDAMDEAKAYFNASNDQTVLEITNRMHTYENTLQSSAALLNTVEKMNRHKWHIYISSLELDKHYPGFQGIGFSTIIPQDNLNNHIAQIRAEGFDNYSIKPSGKRKEYHSIIYLEPLNKSNQKAIGYDMFTDPIRKEAMERARDTGETALSGKVTLVQEQGQSIQAGFLMYVPFYHTQEKLLSTELRRENLIGFTYAPFRANDLINEILHKKNPKISLKIYSGTALNNTTLLYESDHSTIKSSLFKASIPIMMYGQTWTAVFQTLPSFETIVDHTQSRFIILAGLPISFLLLLTILSFSRTAEQARKLAKQMTVEIRVLNTELENMIYTAPNPIIVHTQDGTIIKINKAWCDICGYSLEETPTIDSWIDRVYKEHQEEIKGYIRTLYNITDKVDEGEFSFYSKSGSMITWQFSSAPFGTINGAKAIISSAMDITELKNKDTMLIMQSRHAAMGEMINMIAHQWRQPLASISTIAGTLHLEAMLDQYDQNHFMEKLNLISDLAIDLSDTINDFRNFSKEDKTKEVTTLKKLVDGSLAIVQPMLNVKNIELHLLFNQDPTVKTYPREIRQVILNILKNAEDVLVENAIQNPQIWIRTFYKDGKSCLEIEDNGGGIPNDILNKIFDPYFSTKFEKDGTGIGLYMSKTIVEQHNKGSLTAYNTTNGVCFKITLPTLKYIKHKEKNSTS